MLQAVAKLIGRDRALDKIDVCARRRKLIAWAAAGTRALRVAEART